MTGREIRIVLLLCFCAYACAVKYDLRRLCVQNLDDGLLRCLYDSKGIYMMSRLDVSVRRISFDRFNGAKLSLANLPNVDNVEIINGISENCGILVEARGSSVIHLSVGSRVMRCVSTIFKTSCFCFCVT